MYEKPTPPEIADYWDILGVSVDASKEAIKKAFRVLALRYHPDKQTPGVVIDTSEFRQAREAYEILIDPSTREAYEDQHSDITERWAEYRRDLEMWERLSAIEAEVLAEKAHQRHKAESKKRNRRIWLMGKREQARRAAQAREEEVHSSEGTASLSYCECAGCYSRFERIYSERRSNLPFPSAEEYAEYLEMQTQIAEKRSCEAAQRQREQQEKDAQERIKKENERVQKELNRLERVKKAEERKSAARANMKDQISKEAARRARAQQDKDARKRMAKQHVQERHDEFLRDMKESDKENKSHECVVDIGWTKKKGIAQCLFCDEQIKYYSFHCPEGGAVACNPCKNKMSRFTMPKSYEEGNGDVEDVDM